MISSSLECKQLIECFGGSQLASLGLRDGQNTIDFMFGRQRLRAYIYFLHWHTRCACAWCNNPCLRGKEHPVIVILTAQRCSILPGST